MTGKKEKAWMIHYEALAEFKKTHGHCYVPKHGQEHKLALWVCRQRQVWEKNKLAAKRKELLDNLGFYWNANDYFWDQHFNEIKQLCDQHGHVNIPFSTKSLNDSNRMYQRHMEWAKEQRLHYILRKQNNHHMMSDRRLEKLESIGFLWRSQDKTENESLEKCASNKNLRWILRKLPNYQWPQVLGAISHARKEFERTGKPAMAMMMVQNNNGSGGFGRTFFQRESDGTIVPVPDYLMEHVSRVDGNFIGFGFSADE